MEQNQPFKKRIIEQPVLQRSFVKLGQPSLYQPKQQYYQYESISESNPPQQQQQNHQQIQLQQQLMQYHQPIQQQYQSQQHQHYQQPQQHIQPIQSPQQQIIHYDYIERPMTLNAWTQTRAEDFAPSYHKNETVLLAKIRKLEQNLQAQAEYIIQLKKENFRTPSPEQDVPNSTTITPTTVRHDDARYRILAQADEDVTSDAQIEIEFSDDGIPQNLNYSTDSDRLEICLSDESEMSPRTPSEGKRKIHHSHPDRPDLENATVSIGLNGTKIPVCAYEQMNWSSSSLATRKLLSLIFDRETLATHSMTGKASPAFKGLERPVKGKLDPDAIQDIIFIVSKKCKVSQKEVRAAITTKCADENKMNKLQTMKGITFPDAKRPILRDLNGMSSETF